MRVIQTIASTRLDFGGPSRSVPALCNALLKLGIANELVTTRPSEGLHACNLPVDRQFVHLVPERNLLQQLVHGSPFCECLRGRLQSPQGMPLVHDHAIWLANNHSVARFCRQRSIRRIVSPRGMLGSWAMGHSKWKKRLAWNLFQKRDLQSANGFHATSEQEAEEIRTLGFKQPIAVVPNGVDFPDALPDRTDGSAQQFLFMSRIHPKKGLDNLVRAWKAARVAENGWRLKIVGPDENGYRHQIEKLVDDLELRRSINFHNEVGDTEKWQMYVDSDFFILPSFNENFGIVIAEALAAGVPTIASKNTPWSAIESMELGWWVDNDIATLTEAIRAAVSSSPTRRAQMGQRASHWIREEFSWLNAGKQLASFYETIAHND